MNTLRKFCPNYYELITPGIRTDEGSIDDQSRVMNPSYAIREGATRLVVGRPITQASNPGKVFESFCKELTF